MELAVITFWQVATLFILIFMGALSLKTHVVTKEARGVLANLLLYLVVPAMMINSYLGGYSPEVSRGISQAFLYSALAMGIGLAVSLLLHIRSGKDGALPRFGGAFANAAYMGFPLIEALFGQEGLIFAGAFVTVFNVLLFTVGVAIMSGGSGKKNMLKEILGAPVIWSVAAGLIIYYARIPVPKPLASAIGYISAMNTPVSMMMTGILIASSDLGGVIKDKTLWTTVGLRLVVVPVICVLAFRLIGISGMPAKVALLLEACPCAAITSVFAVRYSQREDVAGALVVVSTLLSIVTLPLMALILP